MISWKVSPLWCRDLSEQCGSRKWTQVGENNDGGRTGHQSSSCALLPALEVASLLAKQTNAHLDIFFFASDVAAGMMHRVALPSSIRLITLSVNSRAVAFVNVFTGIRVVYAAAAAAHSPGLPEMNPCISWLVTVCPCWQEAWPRALWHFIKQITGLHRPTESTGQLPLIFDHFIFYHWIDLCFWLTEQLMLCFSLSLQTFLKNHV